MFRFLFCFATSLVLFAGCRTASEKPSVDTQLYSPDERIRVSVNLPADDSLTYRVDYRMDTGYVPIIEPSRLGLVRSDGDFSEQLGALTPSETTSGTESYTLTTGKQREHHASYREKTYTVETSDGRTMTVRFRVFNDGLGFRYEFGEGPEDSLLVQDELTTFNLPTEGEKWLQPYDSVWLYAPAYEQFYEDELPIGTPAPDNKNGWSFPALFHTRNVWILLSESGLDGSYVGMHLNDQPADGQYQVRFPEFNEARDTMHTRPKITLPWSSPWRVIHLAGQLGDIVTSDLVHHLARPSVLTDASWVKPGKASWSWWYYSDSPLDYHQLTPYVDLAAEMGWKYSLVDANWNRMKNGDLEQLVRYADEKGVKLLVWYNSGGPNNEVTEEPRDRMHRADVRRKEFRRLQELGVAGLKIDFFQSDKQPIIQWYIDILEDAVEFELLVNFHGCTLPRGWSRTYPHLMTMEAVFGAEAYKFSDRYPSYAPTHNTILPFTRNVVGPMDFTPVTLSDKEYPALTTVAHELALPVVFESGLLHLADRPEAYRALRPEAIDYLTQVPVAWDETRLIDGYPGDYVIIARRAGEEWYLAGIQAGDTAQSYEVKLDFLPEGSFALSLLTDDTETNLAYQEKTVTPQQSVSLELLPYGGAVGVLRPKE